MCFSACKDDETSADTFEGGMYVGAMSYVSVPRSLRFCRILNKLVGFDKGVE